MSRCWVLVRHHRHAVYGLALLRVGYGVMILAVLAVNAGDWQYLWGPSSPWTRDDARDLASPSAGKAVFLLVDHPAWTTALLLALGAGAVALVVGWHSRVAVVVVAVLWQGLGARNYALLNGGDAVATGVLFYLCFASTGAVWSLDARRRGPTPPQARDSARWQVATLAHNGAVAAVVLQLVVVYVASSVYKLQGGIWRDGTAVYWAMRPGDYAPFPLLSQLLWQQGWLVVLATYGALAIQLTFPLALLHRYTRRLALVATTVMHASIGVLLGLPAFSLIMIATEAVLVRDREWLAVGRTVRAEVAAFVAPGSRNSARALDEASDAAGDSVTSVTSVRSPR